MTICVQIPPVLRHECGGAKELACSASTVRAALDQLKRDHPALYRNVCDETGAVRRHINLFVNNSFLHQQQGLDTALAAGDVLTIMPAVSGG
ncbi:MAG: MoaD/ThiS family protein [Pirellulales bacterium]